jgi:DNA polymerase (family 10)
MTKRLVAAIEHPWIDCIGHLTGRKIERRKPYEVDVDAVFAAAAATGTMLEINSAPDRRDLSDVHARAARAAGVTIIINTDAHGVSTQGNSIWGIATARRAGFTAADVANTLPWAEFGPLRKHARAAGS